MAETKKTSKLSLKPGVKTTPVIDEQAAWVESRNGIDTKSAVAKEEPSNSKMKRITFEVTETQHQTIKICATKKGMSIKELMISLIEQELED
jgi:predicted DNA binding CopG/RHH family protein